MDDKQAKRHIARCFAVADELVEAVEKATQDGHLDANDTITVVGTDLYESSWDAPGRSPTKSDKATSKNPLDVLADALAWVRARRRSRQHGTE